MSLNLAKMLNSLGLNVWRETHPTDRDFTHYSAPHATYTRIDHIFLSSGSIPLVHKKHIREMAWSDHSMVCLVLSQPRGWPHPFSWQLNESLLSDPICCIEIDHAVHDYLQQHDTADVTSGTLKAPIRGKIIQISTQIKRALDRSGEIGF